MEIASLIVSAISLVLSIGTMVYTYFRSRPRLDVYNGRWIVCEHARVFDVVLVNNSAEILSVVSAGYVAPSKVTYPAETAAQPVYQRRLGELASTEFPVVLQPFEAKRVLLLFSGENEIPSTPGEKFKRLRFLTSKKKTLSVKADFAISSYNSLSA